MENNKYVKKDTCSTQPLGQKQLLSVVVPVFNESEVINKFYERMKEVMKSLDSLACEFIFVDDGSKDDSYNKLINLAIMDPSIKIIKFSRNFGHQVAITAGIDNAKGDAVVIIDGDLQDPPEVIKQFVEKWREGYDVVYGIRERRDGESKIKLFTAAMFYRIMKRLTNVDIPVDVGDFRLMSKRMVQEFKQLRERDRYVRGLVSWVGLRQTGVYYHRDRRYAGETKYPLKKMFRFAVDGITSFSYVPLKFAMWFGYFTAFISFLYVCYVLIQKILGNNVPGFTSIIMGIVFLGSVQLICLGIMGEYVGRIFNEIKQRPLYVIEEMHDSETILNKRNRQSTYPVELPNIQSPVERP